MELILDDVGPNDGQFSHLMTQGSGVGATEGPATTATGGGHTGDGSLDLILGDQQALVAAVAQLTSALVAGLARTWGRPAFAVEAVRGWRQGGVAGIGIELDLGVREMLLEVADMFLLLGKRGLGVVDLHLQAAVAGFQFGDAPSGVGLLQFDDAATKGAQVGTHVLWDLGHRFRIHHADRQHADILSAHVRATTARVHSRKVAPTEALPDRIAEVSSGREPARGLP